MTVGGRDAESRNAFGFGGFLVTFGCLLCFFGLNLAFFLGDFL